VALLSANTNNHKGGVDIAAKVFGEYGDFIHAVIRCKVRNEAQADDLFQDFFLSLVSRPPPAEIQNLKGYLYRAITNDIIDAIRRTEKYQSRIHRYAERSRHPVAKHNPENDLIAVEEMNKIFKLIERRLRYSEAKAIILRYRNHYEIEEVAGKMHVSSITIRGYISDGLKKIRKFLRVI